MRVPVSSALVAQEAAYRDLRRQRRLSTLTGAAALAILLAAAAWMSEFSPASVIAGFPRIGEYFSKVLPSLEWANLFSGAETEGSIAFWLYRLDAWLLLLLETAQMAAIATVAGAAVALLLAFPAAKNLGAPNWVFQLTRRVLEATRTVPEIVFALIFVWAFGVGALAGILAIALHTTGALGKLFADAMENVELRPWDGVRASGGTWFEACRFAVMPAAMPDLLSYAMLRFEVNLRSASVIGFVGAGGIGEELYKVISFNYYEEISAIILLIILAVMVIDMTSERLRRRVIEAVA